MVEAFEKATGVKINYKFVARRAGDVCTLYAKADLAKERLGWQAVRSLEQMCSSAWHWQSKNPNGYRQ